MKDIQEFVVKIAGSRLMMHNGRLSDPLDPYTKALKEITGKKKKSDEDHEEVGRREFVGSLYWNEELGPYIPGEMLIASIIGGATRKKLGKAFKPSVMIPEDEYALMYEGPRDPKKLWADKRFVDRRGVVVQRARVVRTRPIFRDWELSFNVQLLPSAINPSDLEQAINDAGEFVGIGDFRPRFGRFTVESFKGIRQRKAA